MCALHCAVRLLLPDVLLDDARAGHVQAEHAGESMSGAACADLFASWCSPDLIPVVQGWEECTVYDKDRCGLAYSGSNQAIYCNITSPSIWPALMQVGPRMLCSGQVGHDQRDIFTAFVRSTALMSSWEVYVKVRQIGHRTHPGRWPAPRTAVMPPPI